MNSFEFELDEAPMLRPTISDLIDVPFTGLDLPFDPTDTTFDNIPASFQLHPASDDSDSYASSPYSETSSSSSPPSLPFQAPNLYMAPIQPGIAVPGRAVKTEVPKTGGKVTNSGKPNPEKPKRKRKTALEMAQMTEEALAQEKNERNKMSATKYRKKRKMYLDGLEGQITQLNSTVEGQNQKISSLESENKVLREQLSFIKSLLWSQKQEGVLPTSQVQVHTTHTFAPSTPQTAGVFFALFACVMMFMPWGQEARRPKTFAGAGAGRVLLSVNHEPAGLSAFFVLSMLFVACAAACVIALGTWRSSTTYGLRKRLRFIWEHVSLKQH